MNTISVIRKHLDFDPDQKDMPIRLRGFRRTHLLKIFRDAEFTNGAEIGTWEGEYARQILKYVPNLHLYCVDPWKAYSDFHEISNETEMMENAYQKTLETLDGCNVTILRQESKDAVQSIPDNSLDFVFLDGNHTLPYIISDLYMWTPKVRSGGIISGHDYLVMHYPPADIHVKLAIDAWTEAYSIRPWFILTQSRWPAWFWVKDAD